MSCEFWISASMTFSGVEIVSAKGCYIGVVILNEDALEENLFGLSPRVGVKPPTISVW